MRFFSVGISLRTSILLLLVCVVLLSNTLVGWVLFSGSREAVRDMGLQLRKEVSHRISEHLLDFLRLPHEINSGNAAALQQGRVSAEDPERLIARFAEQVALFPSVSSIYFGNARGGVANSGRDPEHDSRYVIRTDGFAAGTFRKYALDPHGRQGGETASAAGFDARTGRGTRRLWLRADRSGATFTYCSPDRVWRFPPAVQCTTAMALSSAWCRWTCFCPS